MTWTAVAFMIVFNTSPYGATETWPLTHREEITIGTYQSPGECLAALSSFLDQMPMSAISGGQCRSNTVKRKG